VTTSAFAPAKLNLFLHVGPVRRDGFHPVCSLMAFADLGDRLSAAPAQAFGLQVVGPHAAGAPADEGNLVMRAARALFARAGVEAPGLRLTLDKQLPVAAGLGGGSSDAAAAMKLLREQMALDIGDETLEEIAAALGSDVPVCLRGVSTLGEGRGEVLRPGPGLPPLHAVLLDPGVGSSTPAVYRAYDEMGAPGAADRPAMPAAFATVEEVAGLLERTRNDLEAPAVALEPRIGEALETLRGQPETLFARMSGSGSSCFAICADAAGAASLAVRLAGARACRLA